MKRILIVEGDSASRLGVRDFLRAKGLEVNEADSWASAEEAVRSKAPDAAVLDYRLPDGDALALLPRLKAVDPDLPVVILTPQGTVELAAKTIQSGADQFLPMPVELDALQVLLQRLLEAKRARQQRAARQPRRGPSRNPFLGTSALIRQLEADAHAAAEAQHPVLIVGEKGSGKGVLAEWLHDSGPRAEEAFAELNCAGYASDRLDAELFGHEPGAFEGAADGKPGLFEIGHHGTVFLDEVGNMDLGVQAKILRVIEEQRVRRLGDTRDRFVDVHLLSATCEDLQGLARQKKFREDLYIRMRVIMLRIPPLRERPEDVAPIARSLIDAYTQEMARGNGELDPSVIPALTSYPWPGNVRELRNAIERAILRAEGAPISGAHLALDRATGGDDHMTLAEMERRHIERALEVENGHVERAAKRLGVPRSTLYQRLRQMGIPLRRAH
ncbi:MAG TPA: sigma-54 dependent transcriptional regulator [Candidatus Eisenbacteria bacterium]|nr:sigma-54 dependent transcriptional regulator [Candidatus Eisenbacteria bacterium]